MSLERADLVNFLIIRRMTETGIWLVMGRRGRKSRRFANQDADIAPFSGQGGGVITAVLTGGKREVLTGPKLALLGKNNVVQRVDALPGTLLSPAHLSPPWLLNSARL